MDYKAYSAYYSRYYHNHKSITIVSCVVGTLLYSTTVLSLQLNLTFKKAQILSVVQSF